MGSWGRKAVDDWPFNISHDSKGLPLRSQSMFHRCESEATRIVSNFEFQPPLCRCLKTLWNFTGKLSTRPAS